MWSINPGAMISIEISSDIQLCPNKVISELLWVRDDESLKNILEQFM